MNALTEQVSAEKDYEKKQLAVIALRKEQAALTNIMSNVSDISQGFKVMMDIFSQMRDQLFAIDAKLDELTSDVRAMRLDIQRLAGLPVEEVLEHYRKQLLSRGRSIPGKVYVPLLCRGAPDRPASEKEAKTPNAVANKTVSTPILLVERVRQFLNDQGKSCKLDPKGILLITGQAGSGKSVCAAKIEELILGDHYEKRKKEKKTVILVWANLPQLKRPVTGLFDEALSLRYHLRSNQVHDLRSMLQDPKSGYEAVFVLEAYDELRPEYRFKNLFKTNNLELYRPQVTKKSDALAPDDRVIKPAPEKGAEERNAKTVLAFAQPKVIVLCRKELLSSVPGYEKSFVPLESLNEEKDEVSEALDYFEEVEIAAFDDNNRLRYFRSHVALQVRKFFEKHFFHIAPLPPDCPKEEQKKLFETILKKTFNKQIVEQLLVLAESLCAPFAHSDPELDWQGIANSVIEKSNSSDDTVLGEESRIFRLMAYFLYATSTSTTYATSTSTTPSSTLPSDLRTKLPIFLKDIASHGLWTSEQLVTAFGEIKELNHITTTPFMVEIMVNVLPMLKQLRSTPTSVKQELILLTSEEHAEVCWALLREAGMVSEEGLKQIQKSLQQQVDDSRSGEDQEQVDSASQEYVSEYEYEWGIGNVVANEHHQGSGQDDTDCEYAFEADEQDEYEKQCLSTNGEGIENAEGKQVNSKENHVGASGANPDMDDKKDHHDVKDQLFKVANTCADKVNNGNLNLSPAYIFLQLRRALRRKPVRRALVYDVFLDHLMRNKVEKARETSGSSMTHDQILREALDYSGRLACQMTCEGLTQVAYVPRSQIFQGAVADEWFSYFGSGDEHTADRAALREVAPLKQSGGIYSFLHKSVQEYLVAKILNDSLCRAVDETSITPQELLMILKSLTSFDQDETQDLNQSAAIMHQTSIRPNQQLQQSFVAGKGVLKLHTVVGLTDRHRKIRALSRLCETLAKSFWQSVNLNSEEAICDFLVDMLLDDSKACAALDVAKAMCKAFPADLEHLDENIKSLTVTPLPKRFGGTLLHAAATEGVHNVIKFVTEHFPESILVKDSAGKTALALAMANDDELACEIFVSQRESDSSKQANNTNRDNLVKDCESFPVRLDRFNNVNNSYTFDILSAEIAGIRQGKAYFEIKLDLQELKVSSVWAAGKAKEEKNCCNHGFGGQICIGFARGSAPKERSIVEEYKSDITVRKSSEFKYLKEYLQRIRRFVLENQVFAEELGEFCKKLQQLLKSENSSKLLSNPEDVVESVAQIRKIMSVMSEELITKFLKDEFSYAQKRDQAETPEDQTNPEATKKIASAAKKDSIKKRLKDLRRLYEDLVTERMERCPIGNAGAPGSATYPEFYGISLLVVERFGAPGEFELYCKRLDLGNEDDWGDKEAGPAYPADPAKLIKLFDQAQSSADTKEGQTKQVPKPLILDGAVRQDKVNLMLAIEFSEEQNKAVVKCCWSAGGSSNEGQFIDIQTITMKEDADPVFPVLAFWNISKSCLVQTNFGRKPPVIKPPDGFKPLITLVPGRPAIFVACKNKCWDFAKNLLTEFKGDALKVSGALTWIDSYTGDTVLHHFLKSSQDQDFKFKTIQDFLKLCQNKEDILEAVLLAQNKSGYCAFSLVEDSKVAQLLLDHASSHTWTRVEMLEHLIKSVAANYLDSQRIFKLKDLKSCPGLKIFHEQLENLDQLDMDRMEKTLVEMADAETNVAALFHCYCGLRPAKSYQNFERIRDAVFKQVLSKKWQIFKWMNKSQRCQLEEVKLAVQSDVRALKFATGQIRKNPEIVKQMLELRGKALEYVEPDLQKDPNVVLIAVNDHGDSLQFANLKFMHHDSNREVVMCAVKRHGRALRFASDDLKDDIDVVSMAVAMYPAALEYASEKLRDDQNLVLQAVKADGLVLRFASRRLKRNRAVVEAAISSDGMALQYASKHLRCDEHIMLAALNTNPMAILFTHPKLRRSTELVFNLAYRNPSVLRFAVESEEVVLSIIKHMHPSFVPVFGAEVWLSLLEVCSMMSLDMKPFLKAILTHDGMLLKFLPEIKRRDSDLVQHALESSQGRALQHADQSLQRDPFLTNLAVKLNPANLAFVQPDMDRKAYLRICRKAVNLRPAALAHVDRKALEDLDLQTVLDKDGMALEHIPDDLRGDLELVKVAVSSCGKALRFVPPKVKKDYPEVIEAALKKDGAALEYVSAKHEKFCKFAILALRTHGRSLLFVPEHLRKDFTRNGDDTALKHMIFTIKDALEQDDPEIAKIFMNAAKEEGKDLLVNPFIKLALEQDGSALEFVDPKSREKYILTALKSSGKALPFVPPRFLRENAECQALLPHILRKHGVMLRHIPSTHTDYRNLASLAVEQDMAALEFAQSSLNDEKLCVIIRSRRHFAFDKWLGPSAPEVVSDERVKSGQGELEFRGFSTVTCPNLTALRGSRLYYEVEIVEIYPHSTVQFGFADHSFHPEDPECRGVGDDGNSWAIDGVRHLAWHNGKQREWPSRPRDPNENRPYRTDGDIKDDDKIGGEEGNEESDHAYSQLEEPDEDRKWMDWQAGDVIGLACDPDNELIAISVNGEFFPQDPLHGLRETFLGFSFRGPGLYPALSGSWIRVQYNFGPHCGGEPFRYPPPPWVNMNKWLGSAASARQVASEIVQRLLYDSATA